MQIVVWLKDITQSSGIEYEDNFDMADATTLYDVELLNPYRRAIKPENHCLTWWTEVVQDSLYTPICEIEKGS